MDAQEILDWQVLETIEPFGQAREDARFAMLASVVANAAGATKANKSRYTTADFMLDNLFSEKAQAESKEQTPQTIEAMFRMAVAANNAFWKRKETVTAKPTMRRVGSRTITAN